jgi:hypothetical protein
VLNVWWRAGIALLVAWVIVLFFLFWAVLGVVVDALWARWKRRRYATQKL